MRGKKSIGLLAIMCLVLLLAAIPFLGACTQQTAPTAPSTPTPSAPAPAAPSGPTTITPTTPSAPSTSAPAASGMVYELKFSHFFSAESIQGKWLQMWTDKMNAESGGELKIRMYPSGVLLAQPDLWPGVSKGIADIGYGPRYERFGHDLSMVIGRFMLGVTDVKVAAKIMADCQAQFPEVAKEWEQNYVYLNNSHPPGQIHNNVRELRTPADLKGLEIRASNADAAKQISAIGGTPVVMPMSESYDALQKGTVDGILSPTEVLENFRLAEVLKYTTNIYLYMSPEFPLYFNWDSYNSLPANVKKVLDDNRAWAQEDSSNMWAGLDASAIKFTNTLKPDYKWTDLTPAELQTWYDPMQALMKEYADALDAKGLPGTQVWKYVEAKVKEYAK